MCQSIILADSTILDVDGIEKQGQELLAGSVSGVTESTSQVTRACSWYKEHMAHIGTEELLSYVLYLVFAFIKLSKQWFPLCIKPLKEVTI